MFGNKKKHDLGFLCSIYLRYQVGQTHYNVSLQSIWTQLQFSHSLNERFKRFSKLDIFFWKLMDLICKKIYRAHFKYYKKFCMVISRLRSFKKSLDRLSKAIYWLWRLGTGITKLHEIIVNTFSCVLSLFICFHTVKGIRLEPT